MCLLLNVSTSIAMIGGQSIRWRDRQGGFQWSATEDLELCVAEKIDPKDHAKKVRGRAASTILMHTVIKTGRLAH